MLFFWIPILCWILIILILYKKDQDWRSSFLMASILWGVFLTLFTELLSLFEALSYLGILFAWSSFALVLGGIYLKLPPKKIAKKIPAVSLFLKAVTVGILVIVLLTLVTAIVSPPNTFDSMTYHMARVVHWIQNQSVNHYQTSISRQLWLSPWSEFAITHFQILSDGDYFANLIQWFSMLGCLIGVTLIGKELGANLRIQIFIAAIAVTIPMGIVQASSTQNDYVVSFWLICLIYFALRFKKESNIYNSTAAGAALGLAILTKGTAYIYAFPFLLLIILPTVKKNRGRSLKYFITIALLVLILNIGHYGRNLDVYGTVLPTGGIKMSNDGYTLSALVSNVIRNSALHTATPLKKINKLTASCVKRLHNFFEIDINDPRTTWEFKGYSFPRFSNREDTSGNLFHFLLIIFSVVFCLSMKNLRKTPGLIVYLGSLILGFLLFCLYLKWQPWHSRLHLPLFVMWVPVIGMAMFQLKKQKLSNIVISLLLLGSIPWLAFNHPRPLIGKKSIFLKNRTSQYFAARPSYRATYIKVAQFIGETECDKIGLKFDGNTWEYPLWVLIKKYTKRMPHIEHIDVRNKSKVKAPREFKECIKVSIQEGKLTAQRSDRKMSIEETRNYDATFR